MGRYIWVKGLLMLVIALFLFLNSIPVSPDAPVVIKKSSCNTIPYFMSTENEAVIKILHPRSTIPVFVKPAEAFTMMFESTYFDEVYAYISTAYEPIIDVILLNIVHIESLDLIWSVTLYVPQDTPIELYNLTVVTSRGNDFFSFNQPRAVSVIKEFLDDFNFVHVSDFHVGDPRGLTESIEKTIGWKSIKKCIEEINLLHPEFVVISGDLVFGQLYPYEYSREYEKCFEILQLFDVPTFLCPGNHDGYNKFREDGLEFWQKYFGPLHYSFNYGKYHFIAVNSYDGPLPIRNCFLFFPLNWGGYISDNQLDWIENDLISTKSQFTVMFLHHNPLWDTSEDSLTGQPYNNREELLELINNCHVDMVLAGHVHQDTVTTINDTIYVTTTTPGSDTRSEDGYWGFRLINIANGCIKSYNYKEPKYSLPTYHLNHTIWSSDFVALVAVENDLEIDVVAHLKFILPLGNYITDKGQIYMERENSSFKEIYISVVVEKMSHSIVTVSPWS